MKWSEALVRFSPASLTNSDAAGILLFARAAAKRGGVRFRWLPLAELAVGASPGGLPSVSKPAAARPYAEPERLRAELVDLARALDGAGVPFALVADPRGSQAKFHRLALEVATRHAAAMSGAAAAPILRLGSRGNYVATLQRALGLSEDGIFGPKTQEAVRAFQTRAGMDVDGVVGPKTWAMLTVGASAPSSQPGALAQGPVVMPVPAPKRAAPKPKPKRTPKPAPKPEPPVTPPGEDGTAKPEPGGGTPVPEPGEPTILPVDAPVPAPRETGGGGGGGVALLILLLVASRNKRRSRR